MHFAVWLGCDSGPECQSKLLFRVRHPGFSTLAVLWHTCGVRKTALFDPGRFVGCWRCHNRRVALFPVPRSGLRTQPRVADPGNSTPASSHRPWRGRTAEALWTARSDLIAQTASCTWATRGASVPELSAAQNMPENADRMPIPSLRTVKFASLYRRELESRNRARRPSPSCRGGLAGGG
jgi:hypothetical protein